MPTRKKITNPKRAASTTTVNAWQRKVARIGRLLNELYASMAKAQRR